MHSIAIKLGQLTHSFSSHNSVLIAIVVLLPNCHSRQNIVKLNQRNETQFGGSTCAT